MVSLAMHHMPRQCVSYDATLAGGWVAAERLGSRVAQSGRRATGIRRSMRLRVVASRATHPLPCPLGNFLRHSLCCSTAGASFTGEGGGNRYGKEEVCGLSFCPPVP